MPDPSSPSDPERRPAPSAAALRIDRGAPRRRRGRAGPWIVGLLVAGAVGWFAWSFLVKAGGALGGAEVREGRAVRVSAAAAAERTTASGYVVARTRAAISPKYPGKLVRLLVDVGDEVDQGQLLAELDHSELDAAVDRAEAEAARAKAEVEVAERSAAERRAAAEKARTDAEAARRVLEEGRVRRDDARREAKRAERLLVEGVVSESERDRAVAAAEALDAAVAAAEASLLSAESERDRAVKDAEVQAARVEPARRAAASAEASLAEARARREDAFIRATFAGRVLRKEAEVGEVIAPAVTGGTTTRGALLTLADFRTLEMEVDVFERDVSLVEEGAPARIVLDAYPEAPFPGKVRQVVPTADRQKATVLVKVAFDHPDERVLPEMGGRVVFLAPGTVVSSEPDRVVVPATAVAEREGRTGVWILEREGKENRVRFREIETGERSGDRVAVLEGLSGGERVVLDPPGRLEDGHLVVVKGSE